MAVESPFLSPASAAAFRAALPETASEPISEDEQWSGVFSGDFSAISLGNFEKVWDQGLNNAISMTLRVDIDGIRPQRLASGQLFLGAPLLNRFDFIASLTDPKETTWDGATWQLFEVPVDGLPGVENIRIAVTEGEAVLQFVTGASFSKLMRFPRTSMTFRQIVIEVDREVLQEIESFSAQYDTDQCPDLPVSWQGQSLTVESVFRRAGIKATLSDAPAPTPISPPDEDSWWFDKRWSDRELHDAMLQYWDGAQEDWRIWVLLAGMHEEGEHLGGLIFDSDGQTPGKQRHGAAVFLGAEMHTDEDELFMPPARRQRFFTLIHEVGHALNLAHAWEKAVLPRGIQDASAWEEIGNTPLSFSWMNYPHRVFAFWAGFPFQFDPVELRFLRHAPADFVRPGGVPFFVNHGFEDERSDVSVEIYPESRSYELLEEIRLYVVVRNRSEQDILLPVDLSVGAGTLRVIIQRGDSERDVRSLRAYLHPLGNVRVEPLAPGGIRRVRVAIRGEPGVGHVIRRPGTYAFQVLVSVLTQKREAATPASFAHAQRPTVRRGRASLRVEERIAISQKKTVIVRQGALPEAHMGLLSRDGIGRLFRFRGSRSRVLKTDRDRLSQLRKELPTSRLRRQLSLISGAPYLSGSKQVEFANGRWKVSVTEPDIARATEQLQPYFELPLSTKEALSILGEQEYPQVVERYVRLVARQESANKATEFLERITPALKVEHLEAIQTSLKAETERLSAASAVRLVNLSSVVEAVPGTPSLPTSLRGPLNAVPHGGVSNGLPSDPEDSD